MMRIEDEPDLERAVDAAEPAVSWLLVVSVVLVGATALLLYLWQGRDIILVQPGGAVFVDRILPAFLLIFLVSAIVALKWPLVGGVIATFGVAAVVPFAVTQLERWSAVFVIAVFALPAALWLYFAATHRHRPLATEPNLSRRRALFTIAGFVVAVVGGSATGRYIYDRIWGPTHPESATPRLPNSAIDWLWSGAVTTSNAVVRARPRKPFEQARLLISPSPGLEGARGLAHSDLFDRVLEFRLGDLDADTRYHYAIEIDGELDTVRTGSFRTFPTERQPVRIAFGSCARVGSNGRVFDAIRELDPAIYVCLGDFHYGDNFVDDVNDYRQVFDVQLTQPAQAALYGRVPIAYVWDDHDYGPNDSHRDVVSRNAAMLAYREYVPHYGLAGPTTAIYQAFSVGRIRVVLTDARSARDPHQVPDSAAKSMLGVEQRDWLLAELQSSAVSHDLVIWVNPVPWIDEAAERGDSWSGYSHERAIIADHIADKQIDNLLMLAGDAHMVAIDDGTHTNYSSEPGRGFPLMHVAALDRPGSTKGGPYTLGPIAGGGHFGVVDVDVDVAGEEVVVDLAAMNWRGERLLHHRFKLPFTGS
jgi:hypothetical protein